MERYEINSLVAKILRASCDIGVENYMNVLSEIPKGVDEPRLTQASEWLKRLSNDEKSLLQFCIWGAMCRGVSIALCYIDGVRALPDEIDGSFELWLNMSAKSVQLIDKEDLSGAFINNINWKLAPKY